MATLDAEVLNTDPGVIALGKSSGEALEAARDNPEGPACQASLAAFRTALTFKTIFTAIEAILAVLTLGAVAFIVVRLLVDDGWDSANTLAGVTAALTGVAAGGVEIFRSKQQKVLNEAMKDVGTYCGTGVQEQLK